MPFMNAFMNGIHKYHEMDIKGNISTKGFEYYLELSNFEGKPARLGGAGKFCSIAGED